MKIELKVTRSEKGKRGQCQELRHNRRRWQVEEKLSGGLILSGLT